jgi:ribose transport system permease protein
MALGALLLAFFAPLSFASPVFLTNQNLSNLGKQASTNGVIALGMTVVINAGGIDLSVGAIAGLIGTVAAMMMVAAVPAWLTIILALALAAGLGVINGVMIYDGRIPPFIVTLGTMTMARGARRSSSSPTHPGSMGRPTIFSGLARGPHWAFRFRSGRGAASRSC